MNTKLCLRALLPVILLVSSAAATAQDAAEFSRALNRIVASAKEGFRTIRGEVLGKDQKGNPDYWRSLVLLPGARDVTVHRTFVHSTFGSRETPQQTKLIHEKIVRLTRASLPEAKWKRVDGKLRSSQGGSESQWIRFQHAQDSSIRVSVGYRITSSGSGRVMMLVGTRDED